MKLAHAETTPFTAPPPSRGGRIEFKTLLEGDPERLDNYQLLLADTDISFKSPRHRHNFDQLRYSLQGPTHTGDDCVLQEGELAYFPEGCHYGPQDQARCGRSSLTMVIQFGGPSRSGYMSRSDMERAFADLRQSGDFEGGVYRRRAPTEGERRNQDSYEALWEHHNHRKLVYPRPRFAAPVRFAERHFQWVDDAERPGVAHKHIATLTEAQLRVGFVRLESGASLSLDACPGTRLLFVKTGDGTIGDGAAWTTHTAVHLEPGETVALCARSGSELLVVDLPRLG